MGGGEKGLFAGMDLQRGRKELMEKTEENIERGRKSVLGRKKNEEGTYDGELGAEGRRGWGILKNKAGFAYEGEWKNDQPNGKGVLLSKEGSLLLAAYWKEAKPAWGCYFKNKVIFL